MDSAIQSVRVRRNLLTAAQILLLTGLYFLSGRLGLELAADTESRTLIWPPAGLGLAGLILFGRRLWPGIFVGALLLSLLDAGLPWLVSLGVATGNSLEAVVSVTLLVRVAGFQPALARPRDVAAFLLIAVVVCTTISPTVGTSIVAVAGSIKFAEVGQVWLVWWLGGVGGVLVVTPVLLMMVHGSPSWRSLSRSVETWLALTVLGTITTLAFLGPSLGLLGFAACIAPFPVLVWAGTRLGPRGATLASSLIILIAALAVAVHSGPFVMGGATESIVLLWAYSMFIAITAFTLAAVVEQRNSAEQKRRLQEVERLHMEKEKLLLLERQRLTREMHDGIGGHLVSALSMVERGREAPGEVAESLRRALDDIRIVIDSLDPNTTDLSTSLGKLRARLEPLVRRNGIELKWKIDDVPGFDLDVFSPEAVLHLLRIIQESVTNAMRHAQASRISVEVKSSTDGQGQLSVSIRDDGCGLLQRGSSNGRGLQNMRRRAEDLGAVLRIGDASPGTRVDLTLPFPS